jgi:hypothetical protein
MRTIEYGEWKLQVNSNELITVTKHTESREYDIPEIIEVQHEGSYVFLQHEDAEFTQVKFEDEDFLVIDKFDKDGEFVDSIGSHVFGEGDEDE